MRDKATRTMVTVLMVGLLVGCGRPGPASPSPGAARPTAANPVMTAEPTMTAAATEHSADPGPVEAIAIQRPGSGSTVASPLQVSGVANPTFEQSLGLRLYSITGELLAEGSAGIEAPIGERGPFAGELVFEVEQAGPGLLQVYDASARDGGIIHLSSVPVKLAPQGQPQVLEASQQPERIVIHRPAPADRLEGGRVYVSGVGRASFEGTLVAEVVDAEGRTVGQQPLIVAEPAMGEAGPFSVEVTYTVEQAGSGRVVVYDPSPAYGGLVHLTSVEVQLQP